MSFFKYFTWDYWKQKKRDKLKKEITELQDLIDRLDGYKTKNLTNPPIMEFCETATKLFKDWIEDKERELLYI